VTPKRVFISHGHNALVKHKLKDFVSDRLHMEPVVLSDQPDLGLTVIEKLERYGKACDYALIVLTADDETVDGGTRARQNVIHELGFFHGVLGRCRVLLLKQSGVDLFSNISGLIYKEFSDQSVESVFEDIRLAVETGDFSDRAESVQVEFDSGGLFNAATTSRVSGIADKLCEDVNTIARHSGVREDRVVPSLRQFIESEMRDADEAIASCEQSRSDSISSGSKDLAHALGSAFGIMAFATIASDMRKKKRALGAMLEAMDHAQESSLGIDEIVTELERLARFYLR